MRFLWLVVGAFCLSATHSGATLADTVETAAWGCRSETIGQELKRSLESGGTNAALHYLSGKARQDCRFFRKGDDISREAAGDRPGQAEFCTRPRGLPECYFSVSLDPAKALDLFGRVTMNRLGDQVRSDIAAQRASAVRVPQAAPLNAAADLGQRSPR